MMQHLFLQLKNKQFLLTTLIVFVLIILASMSQAKKETDALKSNSNETELTMTQNIDNTDVQSKSNQDKPQNQGNKNQGKHQSIVLGAGCFWGAEKRYEALTGVIDAVSGYAGGNVTPTYDEITKRKHRQNPDNHAEVVKVTFDPTKITVTQLLKSYFETHDPTQLNRQGNDIGTQYRSVIFTANDAQETVAKQIRNTYQAKLTQAGLGDITTQIKPLDVFYPAEEYHQDYLKKNPNGYCPDHSTGVKFDATEPKKVDNQTLLTGKQIVVIDADYDCPYCKKFKQTVSQEYQGDIPLTYRLATQLQGLTLKTPTWATPTILFIENGQEVAGFQGYMTPEEFYKALGAFKLGDSEAYAVAFQKGTDSRFCRQYEKFKNTPEGYFIDSLSGAKLFDTKDRFNSGSGWLSFTKAMPNAIIERPDNSFGMQRTEVLSASSGIHLGHVFDDGPNGMPRFCINATVLEFQPK